VLPPEADYDESDSRVVVELESFLRKALTSGDGEVRQLPWLPGKIRVTEHASREEARQVAHDVFASWVRKVRHSIPPRAFEKFGLTKPWRAPRSSLNESLCR
jgi:hypothetical protein